MEDKYNNPIEMFVDSAFKKYSGIIDEMILFGSVATGHTKNDSDIDILVITDGDNFKVEKSKNRISIYLRFIPSKKP